MAFYAVFGRISPPSLIGAHLANDDTLNVHPPGRVALRLQVAIGGMQYAHIGELLDAFQRRILAVD